MGTFVLDVTNELEEYVADYNSMKYNQDPRFKYTSLEEFIVLWGNMFILSLYFPSEAELLSVGSKCELYAKIDKKIINIEAEVSYIQEPQYEINDIHEGIMEQEVFNAYRFLKNSTDEKYHKKLGIFKEKTQQEISDITKLEKYEYIKKILSSHRIDFKLINCNIKDYK